MGDTHSTVYSRYAQIQELDLLKVLRELVLHNTNSAVSSEQLSLNYRFSRE